MNRSYVTRCGAVAASLLALLSGCASTDTSGHGGEEESISPVYAATAEETAFLKSETPIESHRVKLFVNGLGCPLCAANIDDAVKREKYVESVRVAMLDGTVDIDFKPKSKRPSPSDLVELIDEAGFTLVKIKAE